MDDGRLEPIGTVTGTALLVEVPGFDTVRITLQRQRPLGQVRQQHRRNGLVVADDLTLGEPTGVEDLVEVGDVEVAFTDPYPRHGPSLPCASSSCWRVPC